MEENEKLKLDEKYMRAAIKQAQKAYAINETPIGCVIVYEGKIIGRGYNRRNTDKDPLAHAEIKAELTTGVLEEECSALMTGFFRELREKNRRKR